jgi:hypothetical protein
MTHHLSVNHHQKTNKSKGFGESQALFLRLHPIFTAKQIRLDRKI